MKLLRLRILCLLLALSLAPLLLLLAGLYWLPTGFLSFVWFGLLAMVVTAVSVGASGYLVRPVRDLAVAFEQMLRSGGEHTAHSRWVPSDFARVQRAFSLYLKDTQQQITTVETDALRCKQKLLHSERLIQRSLGITQGILHATRDGVFVQDKGGNVIASNEELDKMLGRPVEKSADRTGARLLAEMAALFPDSSGFDALIRKTGENIEHSGDIDCTTTDEPPRILSVHTSPIRSADGSVMGRLWITRDCTGQKRLAEQLKQAQKMEAIGQLTGGIAHDFNNLLTAIRGNLALAGIASADKPDEAKENLEGATRATIRAAELVKQLLGYSRKTAAAHRPTNLNKVVSEVENILRHSIDPRVTVQCELASDLWPAQADPVNIEQVVLNLCLNARDALPETGGRIDITTVNRKYDERNVPPPDVETGHTEYIVITVKDNGSGIPEEKRAHIFDAFYSTKSPGKGTGLGLLMAHDIVQEHGGWIEFDSEVGKGTEFRVYLPKASADTSPPDDEDDTVEGEVVHARGQSGSVLIVDDEDSVRSIAVAMLKHLGYEVTQASDGEQALEKIAAAEKPFNAILLDIFMPKLSGRDTFKRLRADGCKTPVVVCSGFKVEPDQFPAQSETSAGAFDIIQKPYSMDGLARTIEKAVAHGRPALAA
jgi:two-component system, cell cycle sensor histidine kinase and response regulator CckA